MEDSERHMEDTTRTYRLGWRGLLGDRSCPPRSWGTEWNRFSGLWQETTPLTLDFGLLAIRATRINSSCVKVPSLWCLVTEALEEPHVGKRSQYIKQHMRSLPTGRILAHGSLQMYFLITPEDPMTPKTFPHPGSPGGRNGLQRGTW